MKNILKQIKEIFFDNKEYFIRCTIMTLIAALILAISISFVVPASAADEPTEINPVIIPAGTYTFDDNPSNFVDFPSGYSGFDFPLSFSVAINIPSPDFSSYSTETRIFDHLRITDDMFIYYRYTENNGLLGDAYYGNVPDQYPYGWATSYLGMGAEDFSALVDALSPDATEQDKADILTVGSSCFGNSVKTITVLQDAIYDDAPGMAFASWFFDNTSPTVSNPVIQAGFYKAKDNWTTAGWPVTNDSIDIRYYNDAINVQAYVEAEGIAFLRENDMFEIYYADSAVFTDGWNIDGAKNIQVLQDISVDSDFYTVFNNVFESSSQGSNEFESGYAAGYADGFLAGEDAGYNQGYYDGMTESSGNFFTDILGGVLGALDAFIIFGGFSLLNLLTTLLGGMALIWILKLLAGG